MAGGSQPDLGQAVAVLWRLSPRDQERLWQIVLEHGFNLPVVRQLSRFWSERVENHLALLKFTELEFDEVVDQNREQLLEEELCRILRCAEARVVSGGDNWIVVRDGSDSDEAGDELDIEGKDTDAPPGLDKPGKPGGG